jgi:hypothetical protein
MMICTRALRALGRGRFVAAAALFGAATMLLGMFADESAARDNSPSQKLWTGPVPKAVCGKGDRPETGLQGQTSLVERFSGLAQKGFNCNLELVGQYVGEGASYGFAWFDDCAYYGTANTSAQTHPGVVVLDVSDPSHPRARGFLDARAMREPWESLKVHKQRQLLGATKGLGRSVDDKYFAWYDLSDCSRPQLRSDIAVEGWMGHAGQFSPDGRTYYGTWALGPGFAAVDVSNPAQPKLLLHDKTRTVHDISVTKQGTRAYLAVLGGPDFSSLPGPNGLMILDVSDIQRRKANPQIRTVSELYWTDSSTAQVPLPVTINGKPHLILSDERGAGGSTGKEWACAQGLPPHGFARIIDISDERKPKIISKLMLEVNDPANCSKVLNDGDRYSYSSHYCNVDDVDEPTLLACSWRDGGLRVMDISDPYRPKEVAYYKAPAVGDAFRPGSVYWSDTGGGVRTGEQTPSNVRFVTKHGKWGKKELHLWFTTMDNGFHVVRFTHGVADRVLKDRDDHGKDRDRDHGHGGKDRGHDGRH